MATREKRMFPSTRARSEAVFNAFEPVRRYLAKKDYTSAVGALSAAHEAAIEALSREHGLRKKPWLRWREHGELPVVLGRGNDRTTYTVAQLIGSEPMVGELGKFKREVQNHLIAAAPAHTAVMRINNSIEAAEKVPDPDETRRIPKQAGDRTYAKELKKAALKLVETGDPQALNKLIEDINRKALEASIMRRTEVATRLTITKLHAVHFLTSLTDAIQTAERELSQLTPPKANPSTSAVSLGKKLGIDVADIYRTVNQAHDVKKVLPHRLTMLKELQRRHPVQHA